MTNGLRGRLAAAERRAAGAAADSGVLPSFYCEEHLAAFLAHLGRPSGPEAVAAAVAELERGGELRERWLAEHRWPAAFWTRDDWNL